MAKIRIAQKSDIYSVMLVFSAIFMAIGIFFSAYKLKTEYLKPVSAAAPRVPVTRPEKPAEETKVPPEEAKKPGEETKAPTEEAKKPDADKPAEEAKKPDADKKAPEEAPAPEPK